jgi:hypothetical protein
MEERHGRKLHLTGELTGDPDDGSGQRIVFARSRALFITVNPESFLTGRPD